MNNAPPAVRMPTAGMQALLLHSPWWSAPGRPGSVGRSRSAGTGWRPVTVNASPRGCRSGTCPHAGRPRPCTSCLRTAWSRSPRRTDISRTSRAVNSAPKRIRRASQTLPSWERPRAGIDMDAMHGCRTQTDLEHRVSYTGGLAALTVHDVRDAAWLPHSMTSAAKRSELTQTARTPCAEAGIVLCHRI